LENAVWDIQRSLTNTVPGIIFIAALALVSIAIIVFAITRRSKRLKTRHTGHDLDTHRPGLMPPPD
jgi:hypothetical protein